MTIISRHVNPIDITGVLFDLDGTLVDTAPDLVNALNLALTEHGYPTKLLEQVRDAASNGSLALVNAAQPSISDEEKALIQQALLVHYARVNGDHALLFDGIAALLGYLEQHRIPFGVVTNKAARFARPLLEKLNLISLMPALISGDSTYYSKPDAAPMLLAAQQLKCTPRSVLYIGDARRDLEAAHNANMLGAVAMWGYIAEHDDPATWPQDFSFSRPEEIIALLKQSHPHNNAASNNSCT